MGPPDHEKRERFAVGPPDKRSNAENALKQQLFLIPLSVSSVVGFGPGGGRLHGGTLGKWVIYMGERLPPCKQPAAFTHTQKTNNFPGNRLTFMEHLIKL